MLLDATHLATLLRIKRLFARSRFVERIGRISLIDSLLNARHKGSIAFDRDNTIVPSLYANEPYRSRR